MPDREIRPLRRAIHWGGMREAAGAPLPKPDPALFRDADENVAHVGEMQIEIAGSTHTVDVFETVPASQG